MGIDEVEIEHGYREYERMLDTYLSAPGEAEALREAWDMFAQDCTERGIDWYPYVLRATAYTAARQYGRSVDEVLSDLQKWPRTEWVDRTDQTGQGGSCGTGGSCCSW